MIDVKKLNLKIKRLVDSLFVWNYKTAFKWKWLEFSDFRQYDFSDDAKYIDFLASQREWKLLIKRFEEERELNVFFVLDLSESMNFWQEKSKLQTLSEVFYILWLSATINNDKIWALIFDENWFTFVKSWKWKNSLLKILSLIEKKEIKKVEWFDVNKLFSFLNSLPIKNSLMFFLSDKVDEIDDKYLKIQSIKNDFIYINIFDYFENNLSNDNDILKLWFWKKVLFLNLRNKKKVSEYISLRAQKIKNFKTKLSKYKIDYLLIDDKTNIFAKLLKFFKWV